VRRKQITFLQKYFVHCKLFRTLSTFVLTFNFMLNFNRREFKNDVIKVMLTCTYSIVVDFRRTYLHSSNKVRFSKMHFNAVTECTLWTNVTILALLSITVIRKKFYQMTIPIFFGTTFLQTRLKRFFSITHQLKF